MNLRRLTTLALLCFTSFTLTLPTLAQESTPEVTPSADLQTYTNEDQTASVQFPAGWVFEKDNSSGLLSVKLASSDSSLKKELFNKDDVFQSGEVHIEVAVISLTELVSGLPAGTVSTDPTPLEIVQALAKQGMPDEFKFGDPGAITINDNPAVRMNLSADKRGEGQLLLTILDKKWIAALIVYAAPGEGDKWDIIARDVLASITILPAAEVTTQPNLESTDEPPFESTADPLALTQTAKTSNGLGSLSYPGTWVSRQFGSESVYIANTKTALDKSFGSSFAAGEVNILVTLSPIDEYIKQAQLPLAADASPLELLQTTIKVVGDSLKFATPQTSTLNDKRAASVNFAGEGFEGTAWIVEYQKGAIITVQLLTAPNESARWQPTALAVITSVKSTD
ncbi:MAG: hypothetical protein GC179_13600 [Anaerolineaceae bacterium]|nr:hypothetical protein [Anaerolineaceae bacterium]